MNAFQAMVGKLSSTPHVAFTQQDILSHKPSHNNPLNLEVFVHKHTIRRVFIDGGVSLNICALNLVKALGYSEYSIDAFKKINIKSYDDEERPSKGVITLPIKVGTVEQI